MDFKLNMGELEDVLTSLHKMKSSLKTLDRVLVNVQNAIAQQQGKLAEALTMEFGAHRDDISRQQGTVTKLFTYLENYVNDLKDIDSPTYRNQDMLIDARGLQKAAEMQGYALDDAKSEVFRVPQPSIERIPDDPDELWVMRHNQGLMEDLDDYLRRKLTQLQQNEGEAMHRISQDMRRLMEMDHTHASKIEEDYRQYDRNKVRQIGASTRDSIFGFGKRAIESLKHPEKQLESIAMLMKNLKSDPSGTAGMIWNGVVASYLEPYKKGDAYGLTSSTILFASAFGITKGLNDFGKLRKTTVVNSTVLRKTETYISGGSNKINTVVLPEIEAKILQGARKSPSKNELIGGHSPEITNRNPNFAVEEFHLNIDGTKDIQFTTQFKDGNLSKLKKSTVFPVTWNDKQIMKTIKSIGDSPYLSIRSRDGATWHRGIIDGVEIDVIKIENNVVSAYPTGTLNSNPPAGFIIKK